jgi:outer membrane protein assembly factor BamB
VEGDRLWALSENGDLACLDVASGARYWQRNILRDFGGENPTWLMSESPLLDGSRLIVMPGGEDASLVALDKNSGQTLWTSEGLSDQAGYSSALAVDVEGIRTILALTSQAAVGVRADDGTPMWRYPQVSNRTANITTPVFHQGKVFFTSAYGTGAALLELSVSGGLVQASEVYFTREMQNHHGGVVLVDGYLYGFSNNILTCLNFETGERIWRDRSVGKGSVVYADGQLYLLSERNVVGLARATPDGYQETGRFSIEDRGWPSWAHPVVDDGRLYIRNQESLTVYDVRE